MKRAIDLRTDEAKAKDILKEQKIRKLLEKGAAKKRSREREDRQPPHVYNTNRNGDGSVRETNVHTQYNYDGSNWRRTEAENGSVEFTRQPVHYEIGQRYTVDIPVDGVLPGSILIVAGVDERRTLTLLYHCTGESIRTIHMTMAEADNNLRFMPSETTRGNFGDVTTPDWATIIGVCFVTGFVVTAMATAIGEWLF